MNSILSALLSTAVCLQVTACSPTPSAPRGNDSPQATPAPTPAPGPAEDIWPPEITHWEWKTNGFTAKITNLGWREKVGHNIIVYDYMKINSNTKTYYVYRTITDTQSSRDPRLSYKVSTETTESPERWLNKLNAPATDESPAPKTLGSWRNTLSIPKLMVALNENLGEYLSHCRQAPQIQMLLPLRYETLGNPLIWSAQLSYADRHLGGIISGFEIILSNLDPAHAFRPVTVILDHERWPDSELSDNPSMGLLALELFKQITIGDTNLAKLDSFIRSRRACRAAYDSLKLPKASIDRPADPTTDKAASALAEDVIASSKFTIQLQQPTYRQVSVAIEILNTSQIYKKD